MHCGECRQRNKSMPNYRGEISDEDLRAVAEEIVADEELRRTGELRRMTDQRDAVKRVAIEAMRLLDEHGLLEELKHRLDKLEEEVEGT